MAKGVKIISEWEWLLSKPPLFINHPFFEESKWKKWTQKAAGHIPQFDYHQKRLGHHYEDLIDELLSCSTPAIQFTRNLQIVKNKKTTGEIDFLISENGSTLHLEVAVKFYLYSPATKSLISPSGKEHWREKKHKLTNHQLKTGIELSIEITESKAWIQGIIFTPLNFTGPLEIENVNPNGQRGIWLQVEQWDEVSQLFKEGGYAAQYHRDRWGEIPDDRWIVVEEIEEKLMEIRKGLSPYLWIVNADKSQIFVVVHSSWPD